MGEHGRGNLVIFELILAEEKLAGDIPGRSKPVDVQRSTVSINFVELCLAEFEAFFLLPLRRAPGTLPGRIKEFLGVNDVNGSFLEFDRITAGLFRQIN
jgi:hypothetical protein